MTLLLAVSAAGCDSSDGSEEDTSPQLVRTVIVSSPGADSVRYTGVVRARIESDLGFRVGGEIIERLVDRGAEVRAGQTLMRLDPSDFELAAEAAAERLRAAEAAANRAAAQEDRLRRLLPSDAVSVSAYETALEAKLSTAANLGAARAAAREAANRLEYANLIADSDGIVMDIMAEPGQVVVPGTPVLRLGRSSEREAAIAVPETGLANLATEGEAFLYGESNVVPVQLREVAGAADPATRTYEARFRLIGAETAPLGATVTVVLPTRSTAAHSVPLGAIHNPGPGPGVWVVHDGHVNFHPVEIISFGEEAAVISIGSIEAGQRIVALGAHLLHEGQPVRVRDGASEVTR